MLAATGAGARRDTPATYRCLPREAWPEAEPLGCMSPSGKSRGGTPEGERVPLDASRTRQMVCADCANLSAMVRRFGEIRAFRRSASFISLYPGLSETKPGSGERAGVLIPDFASLNPGYDSSDPIVMKPVTTAGFI